MVIYKGHSPLLATNVVPAWHNGYIGHHVLDPITSHTCCNFAVMPMTYKGCISVAIGVLACSPYPARVLAKVVS